MGWLLDFLRSLLGERHPRDGAPVSLPSDEAVAAAIPLQTLRAAVSGAGCAIGAADAVALAFAKAFNRFAVTDPLVIAHVLAHCGHESGGFTRTREDLNYRSVGRIREVFGTNRAIRAAGDDALQMLVRNPEALANVVYADANRAPEFRLGNTEPGDGFRFRGHWWPQLTGRSAITMFARYLGQPVESLVDRDDYDVNALAALWFAAVYKQGFAAAASADDIVKTTRIWNGGLNGLADRQARLPLIKTALGV